MESGSSKAVFISYAREDTAAAQRIAEALRSHAVEVWLDQSELRGGDAWDQNIRRQIKECALFVPVISVHTQSRGEGYFRLEWKLAVERTHLMAEGMPFLAPVVVDETPDAVAVVPAEFLHVQWIRMPGALPTPQFIEQVKRLLAAPRAPARAQSMTPLSGQSYAVRTAEMRMKRIFLAIAGSAVVVAILAAFCWHEFWHQAAGGAVQAPSAAASAPTDKSIAVLPFKNMSADAGNTYFCDGVQEDILTNLANIHELHVISRTSVERYRDSTKPLRQIAQELGVTWVLEGSVQREGQTVRVTGQLINAQTDEHMWAKSYDRDVSNVFAIQAELAETIAASLEAELSPSEKNLVERQPTESLAAYELYSRGLALMAAIDFTPERRDRVEALYTSAVELDPKFADAWAELAIIHEIIYQSFEDHSEARLEKAKQAIANAVALAPDLPSVWSCRATYEHICTRNYTKAAEIYEEGLKLYPNDPYLNLGMDTTLLRLGRWADALPRARFMTQIDPANLYQAVQYINQLEVARRWDDATREWRRIAALAPEHPSIGFRAALDSFWASGSTAGVDAFFSTLNPTEARTREGLSARQQWADVQGDAATYFAIEKELQGLPSENHVFLTTVPNTLGSAHAAMLLITEGNWSAARDRLNEAPLQAAVAAQPDNPANWSDLALTEALLGHSAEALRSARQAVALRPESVEPLEGPIYTKTLALVYAWTGDKDRAIAEFARRLKLPTRENIYRMRSDPEYFPLRGDPRFQALLDDPTNNAPLF
jgi:TolB-like protein/Flp pilus assembly protein TadD